jgi:hypothetical protein
MRALTPSSRALPPRAFALLVVVLAFALAPAVAQAGCGDHVVIPQQTKSKTIHEHPIAPLPLPCPCKGPSCSKNDSAPFTPLATPKISPQRQGASPDQPRLPPATPTLDGPAVETFFLPSVADSAIFHPPR